MFPGDCSHDKNIGDIDGKGAGSNTAKQAELHVTHTHVRTHMYIPWPRRGILYYAAMKHDRGPKFLAKRVCRNQEGAGEPGRLGLESTDERETSGGDQFKPNVRRSQEHRSFYLTNKYK